MPPSLDPPSLVELVRAQVLDAELAALVWVLVESNVPLVVAAPPDRLGAGAQLLAGVFASVGIDGSGPARSASSAGTSATWATPLDAADARALLSGRRPGAVVPGDSLESVRRQLAGPGLLLTEEELSFLGCVLVVGSGSGGGGSGPLRIAAAHYVRPLARDAHGHTQLLGPAVLATWDEASGRWEHFEWGVLPEIAARIGRRAGDLDADLHHRRDDLSGLAAAGVTALAEVRRLVAGYRVEYGHPHARTPDQRD